MQEEQVRRTAQIPEGKLGTVRKAKVDRIMKHYLKLLNEKKLSQKEIHTMEKVESGMDKIYALIDRGINNVTSR